MKEFNVSATLTLTVNINFTVKAKDEESASEKAEKIAEKIHLGSWQLADGAPDDVEMEEDSQELEIDTVDEA